MKRSACGAIALVLAAAALAGCGSTSDHALRITLAALGVRAAQPAPSASSPSVRCSDVTASLRPPAAMPAPGAMPANSFMARIKRRGHLIAGVDQNTLLFSYFNPLNDHLQGFEIDMLSEVARAIFGDPTKIVFKAITTGERIPAVKDGSVDIVADAMTITCYRRTQVDFSTVYFDAAQKVLVPSNSSAGGIGDLAGKRVCATTGSTSIQTIERSVPHPIPYAVDQRTDCLVALQEGRADAISTDDAILLGFKAQDPLTKIVGPSIADEPYGMAISRAHPEFVRFVNGVLARMRADGSWKQIYSHWLGRVASTPAPPRARYDG